MFYDPDAKKEVYSRNLPHWLQRGRLYFVTFRLADSIPAERLDQFKGEREQWLRLNHQPYTTKQWLEYHRLFSQRIEGWLDDHYGQCLLARPQHRHLVADAIAHFAEKRYRLDHWVIMPNHVHVLLMPLEPYVLADILHSWKSYTAHRMADICDQRGQIWQHESFDHIVRSELQLHKFREYIIENSEKCPQKAILSQQNIEPT